MCPQNETLWACLAAMAAYGKELSTAEIAYAAIDEVSNGGRIMDFDRFHFHRFAIISINIC